MSIRTTGEFKDYDLLFQQINQDGVEKLRVVLPTEEFGQMVSNSVLAVKDQRINKQLFETLADDVIDAYEKRLRDRPVSVGFGT